MLAKLIDGVLKEATDAERRKAVITNLSDDQMKFVYGYEDWTKEPYPEYDPETQWVEESYDDENKVVHYIVHEK